MPCGKQNVEQSSMSIDSHEVVPQSVLSACVVIVACGVLIPDPRQSSWWEGLRSTQTKARPELPLGCPMSDWGGLQFRRRSTQFEQGPVQKNSMATEIPTSAIGYHQPPSLILLPYLPCAMKPRIGVIFPLLWVSPFGEINSARPFKSRSAQSTIVTLFGDEGG